MTTDADRLVIQTQAQEIVILRAEVIKWRELAQVALELLAQHEDERRYERTEREAMIESAR